MHKKIANNDYGPVGVIVHLTVKSEYEAAAIEAQNEFAEAAAQFTGHIHSDSRRIPSKPSDKTSLLAVHSFDSADHLIRWLESDTRRTLMHAFNCRFDGHVEVHYPHAQDGFSAWLEEGESLKPSHTVLLRGKTNLLVLSTLYPLTLLLPPLLQSLMPGLSRPTVSLLTAVIAVSVLGFFLIPLLSHRMRYWLNCSRMRASLEGAFALAIFIAAVWLIALALFH